MNERNRHCREFEKDLPVRGEPWWKKQLHSGEKTVKKNGYAQQSLLL
jgi:hypothetical protein